MQSEILWVYGFHIFFHSPNPTEIQQLTQIQYRPGKIASGAHHLTSKLNLKINYVGKQYRLEQNKQS